MRRALGRTEREAQGLPEGSVMVTVDGCQCVVVPKKKDGVADELELVFTGCENAERETLMYLLKETLTVLRETW
jgi:hypothetical protein